jgi:hypothetical protein
MDSTRNTPKIEKHQPPREHRETEGVIAQFIHELSERHAEARLASSAAA